MSRVQLALNVSNIDDAVAFYSRLFATEPAKRRPGYANFAITDPPLKLVLIEDGGAPGTLNHLGVEMGAIDEVRAGLTRIAGEGLPVHAEGEVTCCYALQEKGWTEDPDGAPWELYTVLADAEVMHPEPASCCAPAEQTEPGMARDDSTGAKSGASCC